MECHNPYFKQHEGELLELQCGKCPKCKIRRVNQWVFRIQKEQENSISSKFVTLTYAPKYLPKTSRGLGSLCRNDVQNFIKRLREYEKADGNTKIIKYFLAGEYGDETHRPHYHIILLNVTNNKNLGKAWSKKGKQIGKIDVGTLTQQSIAYTIKYIDKECGIGYHRTDQRERQFQLISKGLGQSYITPQQIIYHRSNPLKNYVQSRLGFKTGMPRYYAKQIWSDEGLAKQRRDKIIPHLEKLEEKRRIQFESKNKGISYEEYKHLIITKENNKFVKNINEYKRNQL